MMMKHGLNVHQLYLLYFVPEKDILEEISCNHVIRILPYIRHKQ